MKNNTCEQIGQILNCTKFFRAFLLSFSLCLSSPKFYYYGYRQLETIPFHAWNMRALNIFSCYPIKEAPFVYRTKAPINQIFDFWQQIFTFHDFKSSSIGVLSSFVLSVFGPLCEEFGHDSTVLPSLRKHAASNTLFGLWGTPLGVIPLMFVKFWINLRHLITLSCKTHKRKDIKMKNCYRDWIEFSAVKDL